MRILIKGAGDLATGIAWRLRKTGHDIVMTDIAVPTTVRRTVAFSPAIYEGKAVVEGVEAVFAGEIHGPADSTETIGLINSIINEEKIAVVIDEKAEIIDVFKPDVIVDAIIAKKNLGTKITDAPCVIGVGPGFTAGNSATP